jgi:hypothetical protein
MSDKNQIIDLITTKSAPAEKSRENPAEIPPLVVEENTLLGGGTNAEPVPEVPEPEQAPETLPPEPIDPDAEAQAQPKRRGRPPGRKNTPKPDFSDIAPAQATETLVDYKQMSCALFDMTTGVLATSLGPEWQPRPVQKVGEIVVDERGAVCSALEVYLKSKQAKDIPPGLMLTIVVVAYAAPRLQAPSTKEKLLPAAKYAWMKVKSFFSRKRTTVQIIPTDAK